MARQRQRLTPDLRRRRATRNPRKSFLIFCEGANTEPGYFKAIRRRYIRALIDIEIISGVGVPMTIVDLAREEIKLRRGNKEGSWEMRDEIWVVFDRNEHQRFDEAVQLCRDNKIFVARSNPCFELWLILHINGYDRPCDRHQIQDALANVRPEYEKRKSKILNFDNLIENIEHAEERATKQLARRANEGSPFGNPSTTVGELTKRIRLAGSTDL